MTQRALTLGDLMAVGCGIHHRSVFTAQRHTLERGYSGAFAIHGDRFSPELVKTVWAECIVRYDDAAMAQSLAVAGSSDRRSDERSCL